jgi:putative flippase GtrA
VTAAPRPALGQVARFLLVGGGATVVDVGLFNVLHAVLGVGPLSAKVLSTVAGAAVAFVGNRQWSFPEAQGRVRHQVLAFAVVNVASLLLALLPLGVARYVLGLTGVLALNVAGNVVGLVLATAFRFWGYRRWVFPPALAQAAAPAPARLEDDEVRELAA